MQKIKNLCTKHEEAIWGFLFGIGLTMECIVYPMIF